MKDGGKRMITENYIKMCEQVPKELWDKVEHCGSLIAWRSFLGVIVPCEKRKKTEGLINFIPETLVIRTWLKDDEDITVLKTNVDYCSVDPDRGTPVYTQEQLQEMLLINKKYPDVFCLNNYLNDFMIDYLTSKTRQNMNECWLAFVMYECWNKIWTGEDWRKENEGKIIS